MTYKHEHYFSTPIYFLEKKEWIEDLNKFSDKYIEQAIEDNKKFLIDGKDFRNINHSSLLTNDDNFNEFCKFICSNALQILDDQGYNSTLYAMAIPDLWVQEFPRKGGGYHIPHIHSNAHISGFYFLKCSDKTSYPIFHDPRVNKKMIQLRQKNDKNITYASELISGVPTPGLFMFFNSYLEHEFQIDFGLEPFRFIHFNLQAVPKELINNNIKRI